MKTSFKVAALSLLLVVSTGCGSQTTVHKTQPNKTPVPTLIPIDEEKVYEPILNECKEVLKDHQEAKTDLQKVLVEVEKQSNNQAKIGYVYLDMNHDHVDDLMIVSENQNSEIKQNVIAFYTTTRENQTPRCVFVDGKDQTPYIVLDHFMFLHKSPFENKGWYFGTYTLEKDQDKLETQDLYFKDDDGKFYHQNEWPLDKEKADPMTEYTDEKFTKGYENIKQLTRPLEITYFNEQFI